MVRQSAEMTGPAIITQWPKSKLQEPVPAAALIGSTVDVDETVT
jgi:hypothetical protein